MVSLLQFQIPILLLLAIGAYQDYKTRIVSNDIIAYIAIFSLPIAIIPNFILSSTINWSFFVIPFILASLFLGLFYYTNLIGGADTKVFIVLLLGMTTNEIFIFFLLFTIPNIYYLIRFSKGIPLFIPILFGYSGVILLSALPILIKAAFGT